MFTCRIADYLHRHLSADEVREISENVDVIPIVTSLDCSGIGGLARLGTLEFSPNLTIIQGRSGVGASRILEALKSKADHDVQLPPLPIPDLSRLSPGERLFQIIHALVEIQPSDTSCLLLDGVLNFLDRSWAGKLIVFIAGQRRQVVLSAKRNQIDAVLRTCIHLGFRLVEETNTLPSLTQCWS